MSVRQDIPLWWARRREELEVRELYYEMEMAREHNIGAKGSESKPGTMCRVEIQVEDRNDVAPQFIRLPRGNFIEVHTIHANNRSVI